MQKEKMYGAETAGVAAEAGACGLCRDKYPPVMTRRHSRGDMPAGKQCDNPYQFSCSQAKCLGNWSKL